MLALLSYRQQYFILHHYKLVCFSIQKRFLLFIAATAIAVNEYAKDNAGFVKRPSTLLGAGDVPYIRDSFILCARRPLIILPLCAR